MPSHARAKNVNYDEDDLHDEDYYDDEEGGEGMTDADREQLRLNTVHVREALGSSVSVTDAQIQEALWHYYFDVEKSVAYLKNKFAPKTVSAPKPKQPKPVSRFDQAASSPAPQMKAAGKQPSSLYAPSSACTAPRLSQTEHTMAVHSPPITTPSKGCAEPMPPLFPLPPLSGSCSLSAAEFFWDTPWGNVAPDRLGDITAVPVHPPGRLLGGSKLAALAAARRKNKEVPSAGPATPQAADPTGETDAAVALLDKLSVKSKETPSSSTALDGSQERERKRPQARYPRKRQPSPEAAPEEPESQEPDETVPSVDVPRLRTGPSMFASTICGAGHAQSRPVLPDALLAPLPATKPQAVAPNNPFAGPSPDDIVLRAQRKGPKSKPAPAKKAPAQKLADNMEKLTVEETKIKSKNLDVVKEFENSNMKRMANFVVIGHVDHGKSTLMGRLLYDLKVIDQRSVDKLRKEAETIGKSSFALAWVMDQTSEERSRGVTVDIATNYFETEKTRFTILDAPGHKDFIPNMIAGASQADFAVLVIDASTNSFESGLRGQTKEHALLVRSMGVQRLIVAVNKMDTVAWSQNRFEEISREMSAFLTTANFSSKTITFIPCAGLTGENVVQKVEDPNANWYKGQSLIEALDASESGKRHVTQPLRLTVGDVFRGGITNPISISGRIEAGALQVGDPILCMPSNETAVIKLIEIENAPADWAVSGQIPTLHLANIDPQHLRAGDIVCDPKKPVHLVKSFTCKILAFEHVLPMSVDVFRGRLYAEGKITQLVALLNKTTGEVIKNRPRVVKPGEVVRVVVELEKELPLEKGTRVVLRESGNTVAAGLLET